MHPSRRPQRTAGWMDGYTHQPSVEAASKALEVKLREGRPQPFADPERVPFTEQEWWAL